MNQNLKIKTIALEWIGDVMQAEQQFMEFVAKADDIGPFCMLSELRILLDEVPSEVRETPLYNYLHGVLDARCFWDKSFLNDLNEG